MAKSRIVAELVSRHLGPDEPAGRDRLAPRSTVGRALLTPGHELEVLTLEQLATLLEVDVE